MLPDFHCVTVSPTITQQSSTPSSISTRCFIHHPSKPSHTSSIILPTMPKFREKFHRTQHDDKHRDNTASASASSSSGRTSRDSKHLLTQSSSPPPYTEVSRNQPLGPSSEDKADATRTPKAIDNRFQMDAGVGASDSSSQSDGKGTAYPGPSTARAFLQLCPHEDLSFERLQIIKGILYEKYMKNGMDIIRITDREVHKEIGDPVEGYRHNTWACAADYRPYHYSGTFRMKLSSKPHKIFGHKKDSVIGLELHVCWTLEVGRAYCGSSRDQINEFLQKSDKIPICPHKMMNDPWIEETVYNFRRVRDVPMLNSVEKHMQGTHKSKPPPSQPPQAHDCDRCKTHVEVSYKPDVWPDDYLSQVYVKITRHLGEGVVENDPAWLAQCGTEPHRDLTSPYSSYLG